jgi:hypothetical protein
MSQCKPRIRQKDNVIHLKSKPKYVPLPDWLSEDLRSFVKYRLLMGAYVGNDVSDGRLFPLLKNNQLRALFHKLRRKNKAPWFHDLWKVVTAYAKDGTIIWRRPFYRVAPHAGRANYVTAAYIVSDKDLKKTSILSGHDKTKDVERYVRSSGIMESKQEIKEKYMDGLTSIQLIPIAKGQKKLLKNYST